MAVNAILGNLRSKVKSVYNNFFYNGQEDNIPSAPAEYEPPVEYSAQSPYPQQAQYASQPYAAQPQQQVSSYAPAPQYTQQNYYQQPAPAQQAVYQQPVYQQPTEPAQPAQPAQQPQQRNRRAWAHQQQENNVVDFNAYQQAQGVQPQAAPAAPVNEVQQAAAAMNARIINARGMGDCRSAITLLRNGDAVVIVLENVADPAEMRRLVDTLSGACYSLTATITKVSRFGVYLLAPQTLAVYADQTTNQMNGAPARPVQPQPQRNYQEFPYAAPQRQPYGYQQPQAAYPQDRQQGFTARTAPAQEPQQPFYTRPAPQAAAAPAFAAQPAGYGYAPDEAAAMEQ